MNVQILKKFCRLAPKEWEARIHPQGLGPLYPTPWVVLHGKPFGGGCERTIVLSSDEVSAQSITFLWDHLCELKGTVSLNNGWQVLVDHPWWVGWDHDAMGSNGGAFGRTRIEALVRACLAVWGSK